MEQRLYNFNHYRIVTTEDGQEISITADDYEYYKQQLGNLTNPLSDDYNKYDNE